MITTYLKFTLSFCNHIFNQTKVKALQNKINPIQASPDNKVITTLDKKDLNKNPKTAAPYEPTAVFTSFLLSYLLTPLELFQAKKQLTKDPEKFTWEAVKTSLVNKDRMIVHYTAQFSPMLIGLFGACVISNHLDKNLYGKDIIAAILAASMSAVFSQPGAKAKQYVMLNNVSTYEAIKSLIKEQGYMHFFTRGLATRVIRDSIFLSTIFLGKNLTSSLEMNGLEEIFLKSFIFSAGSVFNFPADTLLKFMYKNNCTLFEACNEVTVRHNNNKIDVKNTFKNLYKGLSFSVSRVAASGILLAFCDYGVKQLKKQSTKNANTTTAIERAKYSLFRSIETPKALKVLSTETPLNILKDGSSTKKPS